MTNAACPAPEDLSAYVLGRLPEAALEAVAVHAAGCARCQQELQAREGTTDPLVVHLRRPRRDDPVDAEAGLTRALRQAEALGPAAALHPGLAPPQAPDEIGRLGPYRIFRRIGVGGMGVVYEGEDPQLRRRVALKVMKPSPDPDDGLRRRFLYEARAMAALTHDHIVPIYQVGDERGVLFLAMPLLRGETLEERLRRSGPVPGRAAVPTAVALRIGREVAEGLAAAHARGLIHRDVKPSNVWLEAEGDRVKILDFGLARVPDSDARLTRTGNIVGTPEFMAPEQASGKPVDARGDLFSLGCVLYLLCTGVSPFRQAQPLDTLRAVKEHSPPSPREVNPTLPPALAELILKLLAKNPDQRPAGARAAADALAAMAGPAGRPARRWVGWLAASAVAAAALAVAAFMIAPQFLNRGPRPANTNGDAAEKDEGAPRSDPAPAGQADEAFCKWVAGLPPRRQITTVAAKLKELNPDFDGDIHHPLITDPPTPFRSITFTTDAATNISPVRALPALTRLLCTGSAPGKGKLTDLSPLRGMKLEHLDVSNNPVRDVTPLRDLPLQTIWFDDRPDLDLTPLREIRTLNRINGKPAAAFWAEHTASANKP